MSPSSSSACNKDFFLCLINGRIGLNESEREKKRYPPSLKDGRLPLLSLIFVSVIDHVSYFLPCQYDLSLHGLAKHQYCETDRPAVKNEHESACKQ